MSRSLSWSPSGSILSSFFVDYTMAASGNYVVPAEAKYLHILAQAGGGGGSGGVYYDATKAASGAGGCGGAAVEDLFIYAIPNETIAWTVGAGGAGSAGIFGGAGGTSATGGNGQATTFGSYLSCIGGYGGAGATATAGGTTQAVNWFASSITFGASFGGSTGIQGVYLPAGNGGVISPVAYPSSGQNIGSRTAGGTTTTDPRAGGGGGSSLNGNGGYAGLTFFGVPSAAGNGSGYGAGGGGGSTYSGIVNGGDGIGGFLFVRAYG